MRTITFGFVMAASVMAQARFPMTYHASVGVLGFPDFDKRKFVDLGIARVFPDDGNLRFEGKDHAGKPWRVWVPQLGGVGGTEVWTADFDGDGQQDLLIRSWKPYSGRCVDAGVVTVLLFDRQGRPVPWTMSTQVPNPNLHPPRGAIVLANQHGRAEFVFTACEPPPHGGEDRSISGVYEADRVRMVPVRNVDMKPYLRAAKAIHGSRDVTWSRAIPGEWPDQMSGFDDPESLRVAAVMEADEKYRTVDFPILNGRFVDAVPGPLEVLSHDRVRYSDGLTRLGWPNVIIDGPDGRSVYIAHHEDALRRIVKAGYRVKILGNPSEPTWVWASLN